MAIDDTAHPNYADNISGGSDVVETSTPATNTEEGKPEPAEDRKALVKEVIDDIKRRKKKFEKAFKRMKDDMAFAKRGADKDWESSGKYIVPITHRHVQQRVSSLYAKNPTAVAKRRQTVDYQIWDENPQSLQAAQQVIAMTQDPVAQQATAANPAMMPAMLQQVAQATALLQDVANAQMRIGMLKKLGKTLECLFRYYITEDTPTFKVQAKQLVRRVVTCGVGYVKLGFQRITGRSSVLETQIADFRAQVAVAERLAKDIAEKKIEADSPDVEQLRLMLQALQSQSDVLIREGLVFDFPRSTSIIPDEDTKAIKGWVGTRRVAQEFMFTKSKVKELYKVDLGDGYTSYTKSGNESKKKDNLVLVWEEYDKDSGLMYTVADGYCDFLEEPTVPPIVPEQFFPFFPLAFNDIESDDEDDIFPPSDVHLIRHPQNEINRAREALRQHRKANQPKYGVPAGVLSLEEKEKLANAAAHEVIEFLGMAPGEKINDKIQKFDHAAIDPALYDVAPQMDDVLRGVGTQEANLGPTSGATATESSIAEGSRLSSQSSAIDDLDDMLSLLARAASQVLLRELNEETVKKIAGPGAIWPQMTNEEVVEELWLEIAAGSSGRPNAAADTEKFNKLLPLAIQVPGISPLWLAKQMAERLDEHVDFSEAVIDGMPSITAMNSMKTPQAADGQDQGGKGAANGPAGPPDKQAGSSAGGQPGAMPGR